LKQMKKMMKKAAALVLAATMLFGSISVASAAGTGTGSVQYSDTTELTEGFSYRDDVSFNQNGKRVETYSVEISPDSEVKPIVVACDTIYGGMTLSRVIKYATELGYNVLGGINSDFFWSESKTPIGAVIEEGIYKSSPEGENVFAFTSNSAVVKTTPNITINLKNNGKSEDFDPITGSLLGPDIVTNQGKSVKVSHFNKMRYASGGLYLYSEAFSTVSTRTSAQGWAVRFQIKEGRLSVGESAELEVTEIIPSGTAFTIGKDNLVLTATADAGCEAALDCFAVGDRVKLSVTTNCPELEAAEWATGCGDILIENGAITDSAKWDQSIASANPRTAVGVKADGTYVFCVVDGRTINHSNGATLKQLSQDLLDAGCVTAVNFDGGGSSTMAIRKPGYSACTILNTPSSGSERVCSTFILFVTNTESDGITKRLYLKESGTMILSGASIELNALASDAGIVPSELPKNIVFSSRNNYGTISGNQYIAGDRTGDDRIGILDMWSGVSGFGTIHVTVAGDSMDLIDRNTGKTPLTTGLKNGDEIAIEARLNYLGINVVTTGLKPEFFVEGDVGIITEDGLFVANGAPGADGTIIVKFGGVEKHLTVKIGMYFTDTVGHWANEYIDKLFNNGVISGIGDNKFGPNNGIKRCDFVMMLWKAAGSPTSSSTKFTDVSESDYYCNAVSWAAEKGITLGDGKGGFQPKTTVKREQAFAFIARYMVCMGMSVPSADRSLLDQFTDRSYISEYAVDTMSSLVTLGMVSGSDGKLNPQKDVTRAETAKLLYFMLYVK